MHATVVELDALADAIGPAPENHDFPAIARLHLIIPPVISGVVIRRVSLELSRAGIDQTIAWHQTKAFAFSANGLFGLAGQMRDLTVGEPERFGFS